MKDPRFYEELQHIEVKHPQDNKKHMKVAVIYGKDDQKSPLDMFQNRNIIHDIFIHFM